MTSLNTTNTYNNKHYSMHEYDLAKLNKTHTYRPVKRPQTLQSQSLSKATIKKLSFQELRQNLSTLGFELSESIKRPFKATKKPANVVTFNNPLTTPQAKETPSPKLPTDLHKILTSRIAHKTGVKSLTKDLQEAFERRTKLPHIMDEMVKTERTFAEGVQVQADFFAELSKLYPNDEFLKKYSKAANKVLPTIQRFKTKLESIVAKTQLTPQQKAEEIVDLLNSELAVKYCGAFKKMTLLCPEFIEWGKSEKKGSIEKLMNLAREKADSLSSQSQLAAHIIQKAGGFPTIDAQAAPIIYVQRGPRYELFIKDLIDSFFFSSQDNANPKVKQMQSGYETIVHLMGKINSRKAHIEDTQKIQIDLEKLKKAKAKEQPALKKEIAQLYVKHKLYKTEKFSKEKERIASFYKDIYVEDMKNLFKKIEETKITLAGKNKWHEKVKLQNDLKKSRTELKRYFEFCALTRVLPKFS